jgi:hypothetical protein
MAYGDNELRNSGSYDPKIRIGPEHMISGTFAIDSGAAELAPGTPLAYDEANFAWVVWSASGTGEVDEIKGFVVDAVQLSATYQVIGQIMVSGMIHFDDIPVPTGESSADLRQACRTDCLSRGLIVQGLTDVR